MEKNKVREALEIELNSSKINIDEGFKIKEEWRLVLDKTKNENNSDLE